MKGNCITVRCGRRISCNHVKRYGCSNNPSRRKTASVTCGCDWVIIFKFLTSQTYRASDSVEIIQVCGRCTNTCDPSFTDQYVVVIIYSAEYKKNIHSFLQKIMHQISIDQEVSVRTMIVLSKGVLPPRESIVRHVVQNGRLRTLKTKNYLGNSKM